MSCCSSGRGLTQSASSPPAPSSLSSTGTASSSTTPASIGSLSESDASSVRAAVRDAYASVARGENKECIGGSGVSCCGTSPSVDLNGYAKQLGYSPEDVSEAAGNLGLGCGNPVALASLQLGESVLDLGSGAGFDCFLASTRVGPSGRVIGIDMTADMINRARANAEKKQIKNVTFIQSTIESLPLEDASVGVVISNCVINLSPEKQKVLNEAFRVLRPGGRLMVSDIIATRELTPEIRNNLSLYTGCMAGATPVDRLEGMLRDAGFSTIKIEVKADSKSYIGKWAPGSNAEDYVASALISAYKKL